MNIKPAIVVVGFDRKESLVRLLNSLNEARYPDEGAHLLISIDGGGDQRVVDYAHNYVFKGGSKEVVVQDKNLGLRNHILSCADLSKKFGSVILLEDDLYVSPLFYDYASFMLECSKEDDRIAGVALYAPELNENCFLPFCPLRVGKYDNYWMQVPCSWGQAWTAKQWESFAEWYDYNHTCTSVSRRVDIPNTVKNWPESSWKKFFYAYLVERNKYFIYPYCSLTTNFADPGGVHVQRGSSIFQVKLLMGGLGSSGLVAPDWVYMSEPEVVYDGFFEPVGATVCEDVSVAPGSRVHVDLYATKASEYLQKADFVLTRRRQSKIIKTFSLDLKPFHTSNMSVCEHDADNQLLLVDGCNYHHSCFKTFSAASYFYGVVPNLDLLIFVVRNLYSKVFFRVKRFFGRMAK